MPVVRYYSDYGQSHSQTLPAANLLADTPVLPKRIPIWREESGIMSSRKHIFRIIAVRTATA
jgi:hypothetical protein